MEAANGERENLKEWIDEAAEDLARAKTDDERAKFKAKLQRLYRIYAKIAARQRACVLSVHAKDTVDGECN